jgi:aspartate/methionine/tyrosine aminotransferase
MSPAALCCAVMLCHVLCCTEREEASRLPSAVDLYDKAIVLCGLSKSWGLPGLRLGWIAGKDQQLLQQVSKGSSTTHNCNTPYGV